MRRMLLPLLALLMAGGATYGVRTWLDAQRNAPARVEQVEPAPEILRGVLVAARDLVTGEFVQADSLRWQEWPDVELPKSYLLRSQVSETDFVGAVVRRPMSAGEPLSAASVVKPGERGFLAAVLDPGMRAVSVPVDDAASNAKLIQPGDRVDLVLTHLLEIQGVTTGPRRVSETVLTDVRVIAMGRSLKTETATVEVLPVEAKTATLEVTPAGAEKVALANELGKLSLSLRSLAMAGDEGQAPAQEATRTWDQEVSSAMRPENQPTATLSVVRGSNATIVAVKRGAGT